MLKIGKNWKKFGNSWGNLVKELENSDKFEKFSLPLLSFPLLCLLLPFD
jgi:hypothetical protein